MPETVIPHPTLYAVWAPSPHVEAQGEPHRVALFRTRVDAEKAADRIGPDCWIVEPSE